MYSLSIIRISRKLKLHQLILPLLRNLKRVKWLRVGRSHLGKDRQVQEQQQRLALDNVVIIQIIVTAEC